MAGRSSRFTVAIHVLAAIAAKGGCTPVCSDILAGSVNTHPVVIRRLMCALREAGLIRSVAGANGGFVLARPADQIGLGEVYAAVEPEGVFAQHDEPNKACPVGRCMPGLLDSVISGANAALITYLNQWTVDAVAQRLDSAA